MSTATHISSAIQNSQNQQHPFCYWNISNVLPAELAAECLSTPMPKTEHAVRYDGTRAGNSQMTPNGSAPERLFIDQTACQKWSYFQQLVQAFLSFDVCQTFHQMGVRLEQQFLRIEYIEDRGGFYLEPHKDIGEKQLTLQIYLGDAPEHCGTDFYDMDLNWVKNNTFKHNHGYCFIPSDNTWHGLEKKDIPKKRCSLIINYVTFATDWAVPWTHQQLAMTNKEPA